MSWWLLAFFPVCTIGLQSCDPGFLHWTPAQVGEFVETHLSGTESSQAQSAGAFLQYEVDGWALARLNDADLKDLGVQGRMARVQILAFVDRSQHGGCTERATRSSKGDDRPLMISQSNGHSVSAPKLSKGPPFQSKAGRHLEETEARYTAHERLVTDLLEGYQIRVPPINTNTSNVTVRVEIHFYVIEDINVARSEADLNIWFRTQWKDERLSWDPSDYDGVTQISLAADHVSIEQSMIWVPDIELFNHNDDQGIASFSTKDAMVWSDGSVFLSRTGTLGVTCAFKGLADFPYDTIACDLNFGGWSASGLQVDYELNGKGFSFDDLASESEFKEFSFQNISAYRDEAFYDCCPEEPWPTLHFQMSFTRASKYYERSFVIPLIICVFLNFSVFWIHGDLSERLSFSVTMLLTIVAMQLLIQSHVPISSTPTWYSTLTITAELFVVLTMLETLLVQQIYYKNTTFIRRTFYKLRKFDSWARRVICNDRSGSKLGYDSELSVLREKTKSAKREVAEIATHLLTASLQRRSSAPIVTNSFSHHHSIQLGRINSLASQPDLLAGGSSKHEDSVLDRDNNNNAVLNWAALRIQIVFRENRYRAAKRRHARRMHWLDEHGLTEAQYCLGRYIDHVSMVVIPVAYVMAITIHFYDRP